MVSSWGAWFLASLDGIRSLLGGGAPRERIDPDVRDVFLGELDEVADSLVALLPAWRANPSDPETLQTIRRGFHTLKGSGLMVGASTLGVCCGHIEQLALCLIERRRKASPEMIAAIDEAIRLLPACSRAIRSNRRLPVAILQLDRKAQQMLGPV
jgi:chemosensory pili system protein ChpA (sensor histidine kinase/response regulator)